MTFEKALVEIKNGKKVKRKGWDDTFIWIAKGMDGRYCVYSFYRKNVASYSENFPCDWMMCDDWEIVKVID